MAINKEGTAYTFIFAVAMVVVVGAGLAFVYESLKGKQAENQRVKKMMNILGAINVESDRTNAEAKYAEFIKTDQCVVLNSEGIVQEGQQAFDVDIMTEFKDKKLDVKDRKYPLFVAEIDGEIKYVIPMVGSGLWGPIWGNISIAVDKETIFGARFDHKGETPGLGAEIKQAFFYDQYTGEKISEGGSYKKITVVKDGSGPDPSKVNGITGGTITSKGVEEMVDRTLQVYVKYFNSLN